MAPSGLTLSQCQQFFHLPVAQAARRLHVSRPTISKVLRRHGIKRWPFRKLQAQARHAQSTPSANRVVVDKKDTSSLVTSPQARRKHSRRNSHAKRRVCVSPSHSFTASVKVCKSKSPPLPPPPSSSSPPHCSPLAQHLDEAPNSPRVQHHSELVINTPPASPSTPRTPALEHACHSVPSPLQLTSPPGLASSLPPMSPLPRASPPPPRSSLQPASPSPPSSCPSSPPQTPPQTPRCSSPPRSDPFPSWTLYPYWGPSRPSSAKAVFGGAWTRGMFTDSDEGVHFQFLAPGERICTPKLSQNANANTDAPNEAFEEFAPAQHDDFLIHFGSMCDDLYDCDLLRLH